MPAEAFRGAHAPVSSSKQQDNKKPAGTATARVGAGVPQGVLEDSVDKEQDTDKARSSKREEGKAKETKADSKKSLPKASKNLGTPVELEGAEFAGKRREAIVEYNPRAPYEQVVVLDRLKDKATGITTHEIQPLLSEQEVESQLREAGSKAQGTASRERSEDQEEAQEATEKSQDRRDLTA